MPETLKLAAFDVKNRQMMNFVLLIGQAACVGRDGRIRLYQQGDRIRTPTHLTKRFGTEKFRRLSDGDVFDEVGQLFDVEITDQALNDINADYGQEYQPAREYEDDLRVSASERMDPSATSTLSEMSLDDLVKLAAEEEIPLGTAKTKKAIIAIIDGHHAGGIPVGQ